MVLAGAGSRRARPSAARSCRRTRPPRSPGRGRCRWRWVERRDRPRRARAPRRGRRRGEVGGARHRGPRAATATPAMPEVGTRRPWNQETNSKALSLARSRGPSKVPQPCRPGADRRRRSVGWPPVAGRRRPHGPRAGRRGSPPGELAGRHVMSTRSNRVAVNRTRTSMRSPTSGTRAPLGTKSIEACMCGGSAKSRCLPSIENGDRTKPTASRPPAPASPARALIEESPVGASRPMPCGGAAADHQQVTGLGRRARPVAERVTALDRVDVQDGRGDRQGARGPPATGRSRSAAGSRQSAYDARSASSSDGVRWLTQIVGPPSPAATTSLSRRLASARCDPWAAAAGAGRCPRAVHRAAGTPRPTGQAPTARGAACWSSARARSARPGCRSRRASRSSTRLTVCMTRSARSGSRSPTKGRHGVITRRAAVEPVGDLAQLLVGADRAACRRRASRTCGPTCPG